jgi:iron complex outermembrane receptor protein
MRMASVASALLAGVSMLALAAPALAQTSNVKSFSAADKAGGGDAGEVDAVVVTGTRIISNGYQAPTPVTTLSSEALLARAPSNIPDALNQLPQFRGSSSNSRSVTWNANSPNQGNYLNLRGLGITRSLVLLDGVRVPPTSFAGGVDINTLPQALVQRVDVVTGGASAAYGSDALVGVINFILDKNFNGIKGSVQGGTSIHGDADSYKVTLAAGRPFADGRGHIEGSLEHYSADGIKTGSRPNGTHQIIYTTKVINGVSNITTFENVRFANATFGGYINTGPLAGYEFMPGGSIKLMDKGQPTTNATYSVGGDGAYFSNHTLVSPLRTDQAFGRISYEVTPAVNAHLQVSMAESRNRLSMRVDDRYANSPTAITIMSGNAYLQPAVQAALGSAPSFQMSRVNRDTPDDWANTLNNTTNINFGLDGEFAALGRDWHWDANYVYGRNYLRTNVNEFNQRRFYAAVDAVKDPSGNVVCRVTLTNPDLYPGCTPINLFGDGSISPAAVSYVMGRSQYQAVNQMDIVSANITGDVFTLPAGPLSIAFGGEMRRQTLKETSNADPAVRADYTGIRGLPNNLLTSSFTNVGVASGEVKVNEIYGEVAIPLLKDLPFIQSLDVNGAARTTDYSTSGRVLTWKAGVNYVPFDDLRIRATASRDIMAPSLYQLFQGRQVVANLDTDRHTGATASYINEFGGNPDLRPEVASVIVAGIVYSPSWLPGFHTSIDGYSLYIKDAIGTNNLTTLNNDCEASNGTAPACALIIRPLPFSDRTAANFPSRVFNLSLNQAKVFQSGLDFESSYRFPLSSVMSGLDGTLELRGLANLVLAYRTKPSPTSLTVNNLGTGATPRISGSIEANYENGPLSVRVSQRYTGHFKRSLTAVYTNYYYNPNVAYTDLNVSYKFGEAKNYEGFMTIQNLFNVKPPLVADSANPGLQFPTNRAFYDVIGTYFTVGVRFRR